jgi:membrane protein implicated in regulation of membrane protease activity
VLHIDLGNLVFAISMIVAMVLLLITVVLDDVVGGVLDGLHMGVDVAGVSVAPIALGFMAMFGIGGLFGTQALDLDSGRASFVGAGSGVVGAMVVYGMFRLLTRSQAEDAYSINDMVGLTGRVVVGIPAGRNGEVIVSYGGASQKRTATADVDIKSGSTVTVTGVAGSILLVEPIAAQTKTSTQN